MIEEKEGYGFVIDTTNFFAQEGDIRWFQIQADKESVDKFIKDNKLFEDYKEMGK